VPLRAPATWTDQAVQGLLHSVHDAVRACVAADHPSFTLEVQISLDGRALLSAPAGGFDAERHRCVQRALVTARARGRSQSRRPVRLTFA
jgi:hypothetical protein